MQWEHPMTAGRSFAVPLRISIGPAGLVRGTVAVLKRSAMYLWILATTPAMPPFAIATVIT